MVSRKRVKRKSGFTLVEILLVIAILMAVGIMEMRKDVAKANGAASTAVGKQIAMVGMAAEQYMVSHTSALQAMADPNCISAGNACALSVAALISEGFLPADFQNTVKFGGSYAISIARIAPPTPAQAALICSTTNPTPIGCPDQTGSIPKWQWGLQGLIYTTQPWTDGGPSINWAMLGAAAKEAGPQAGVTQAGVANGLFAGWSAGPAFGAALANGQLVYLAGSQVNVWSQFVRRDGSLPMTGTLDMGAYKLMNMRDMFINGPSTNPRNKNLSSMLPNWVFKGAYAVTKGTIVGGVYAPPFIPAPICGNGGIPKIKVMMQLMQGTKSEFYNDNGSVQSATDAALAQYGSGALTQDQAQKIIQQAMADNAAKHSMNSWAEPTVPFTGWKVYIQDAFNQDDSNGSSTAVYGEGLAELYCNYPDQ